MASSWLFSRSKKRTRSSRNESALSFRPRIERLEDRTLLAAFTAGNVVVYRVGTGSAALTGLPTAAFLDEYNSSGTLVQSLAIPAAVSGANQPLTNSGTSTAQGALSRSADGQYLIFAGSLAATGVEEIPLGHTIGRAAVNGTINTTTTLTNFSTDPVHGATSVNGTNFWAVGDSVGVVFTTFGASGPGTVVASSPNNNRTVNVVDGQLYLGSGSGTNTFRGVSTVGTGTPTTSGQTVTRLPGLSDTSNPSTYGFFFADLSSAVPGVDTLYVADDMAGALSKFSLVGGTWVAAGTVGVDADDYRGVTGYITGSTVTLFATRKGGSGAAGGGELVSLVDASGYSGTLAGTPTLLATAANQTAFRGISVTPVPPDTTPPVVQSITRANANPTNAATVTFTVTFSEAVTGVDVNDFALTTTGVSGASITGVSGSGTTYTVMVNTGSGDGTIRLDVTDDDSIADGANNKLGGTGAGNGNFSTGESYTIDKTDPVVQSIVRASGNPTNATSVTYTVTFSEPVTGVGTGDFTLFTTGVSGATITGVSGSGTTYTVSVNTGTGSGTIRLDVTDDDSIVDPATNPLGGAGLGNGNFTTGESYTIDKSAPFVVASTRANPDPTNAALVNFTVLISEPVTGVDALDFALTTTGVSGASVSGVSGSGTTYTVTVNTGSGSGTIRLDVNDDDTIVDGVGNPLAGTFTTGQFYTIDKTAPTVVLSNRLDPNPTNAALVNFTVIFSEPVTGVDLGDFTLATTGVSGAILTNLSGSGAAYTVTVNTGSGNGTIRLDVNDNDSIVDGVGNPLGGTFTTGQVYSVDKTVPVVVSSILASANPTNAASVDFTVTFSEPVTGVDVLDFALTTAGVSGASITGVSGTGAVYTVSVNTGTGSGTIRLDVIDDDSIVDGAANPLGGTGLGNGTFTTGQFYTIDRTAPVVISSNRLDTDPTNAASVQFSVVISEPVTGVDALDFALTTTGVSGAAITGVSGSGAVYTVTVNTGTGSGTIRLDVNDDDSILDAVGNPLAGTFTTGQFYTIDKTAPVVVLSNRLDPNPTNAASVNFTVVISEPVTGVDPTDFILTTTGVSGAVITGVSGSGTTYTVTVNTGTGSGTIRLDVVDDDTIVDGAANPLGGTGLGNGTFTTGQSYTVDRGVPVVIASNRANPDPTNAALVNFTVTFSEIVIGVDLADFALTTTGVSGASITGVSGTGAVYNVSVNTGTGSGTIRLDVIDDDTIVDDAANPLGGTGLGNGTFTTGQFYTVDRTAPVVISSIRANANPTNAASVDFTVTFSEPVAGVDALDFALTTTGVTGASLTSVSGTGAVYTVSVNTGTGSGTIRLDVNDDDSIVDGVGNPLASTFTTGESYAIDKTAPVVVSSTRLSPNPTNAATVQFSVVFSEAVTGVNLADFALTTTGVSGASVTGVSGSGTTYTVTVNTGSGSGTIRLDVNDDDTIVDGVGNPLAGTFTTGQSYTIDKAAPVVVSSVRLDPNPTNAASVQFSVVFSEIVTGVNTADFALTTTGVSGATITGVSGSGTTYTVTVDTGTGNGTIRLDVLDDDTIVDGVGNPLAGTFTTGQVYNVDKGVPVVASSNRLDPNPTNAATVQFSVVFSEIVTGVNLADFALTTTGVSGATITGVSGSGTTYTVTVNTGSGSGTIRLDVVDDDTIVDGANNPLGGTGAGNGNFTTGQSYTIDKSAPTVVFSNRLDSNPTTAASVQFSVVFSEPVTGVDLADFTLFTPGVSGASVTSVSGSGAAYIVSVNTGTGSGTIRLDVLDDDSILDAVNNPLGGAFTTGQSYTLDRTAPDTTITSQPPLTTSNTSATFTFTGSDNVTPSGSLTFQARLDGAPFTSVTSPVNFTGLTPGSHTFEVRAIDQLGNVDPTPAVYTWTITVVTEDWGDAPDAPFQTLAANDGARHIITGLMLGSTVDGEADGQPNAMASGDGSDEDGVSFLSPFLASTTATIRVTVSGAPSGAKLDAWIDWNHDGDWTDPGEQIATTLSVVNGANILSVPVPATVPPVNSVTSFARFRLSSAGGLGITGAAPDGEVEDYALTLGPCPLVVYVHPSYTAVGTDPDGAGPATAVGYDAFATIQQGVDAVCPGGLVNVLASSYSENVVVGKPMTIDGVTAATTILNATTTGFDVSSPGVTIRDLTVTGAAIGVEVGAAAVVTLIGITFASNTTGVHVRGDVGLGSGNVFSGSYASGLVVEGVDATILGLTLSNTHFGPTGGFFVKLLGQAHIGPDYITGDTARFDVGTGLQLASALTPGQLSTLESRLLHYSDDSSVGLIVARPNSAVLDPDTGNIIVYGSNAGNIITVNATTPGSVSVAIGGVGAPGSPFNMSQPPFNTARILIFGMGGSDTIQVIGSRPAELHGGAGNDFLYGGSGDDVMYGEVGNDYLSGGGGNDVLIGGAGQDNLLGGSGHDLLIGGSVAPSQTWTQLIAARAAYLGTGTPAASSEMGASITALLAAISDTEKDTVTGGSDIDLFFLPPGGPADTTTDAIDRVRS